MIISVSPIIKHPTLNDFCYILIKRQEPEIDNNKPYTQKVLGSEKSVDWFRQNIIQQLQQQTR